MPPVVPTYAHCVQQALRERPTGHTLGSLYRSVRTLRGSVDRSALVRALRSGVMVGTWHRLEAPKQGGGRTYRLGPEERPDMAEQHRTELAPLREERLHFRAVVGRRGFERGRKNCRTVLLRQLTKACEDEVLTDHAWLRNSAFEGIPEGAAVRFCARVRMYRKQGDKRDYKFFYPTQVTVMQAAAE